MTPEETRQAVQEFKIIYKAEQGVDLSDNEATQKALSLLQLFDVLTRKEGKVLV